MLERLGKRGDAAILYCHLERSPTRAQRVTISFEICLWGCQELLNVEQPLEASQHAVTVQGLYTFRTVRGLPWPFFDRGET